jgi:hypothetical protein
MPHLFLREESAAQENARRNQPIFIDEKKPTDIVSGRRGYINGLTAAKIEINLYSPTIHNLAIQGFRRFDGA